MSRRNGFVVAAVALLIVAAVATPNGFFFSDPPTTDEVMTPDLPPLFWVLLVVLIALGFVAIFALRAPLMGAARDRTKGQRFIAGLLLVVAIWALFPPVQSLVSKILGAFDLGSGGQGITLPGPAGGGDPDRGSSEVLGGALTAMLLMLVVGSGMLVTYLVKPMRRGAGSSPAPLLATIEAGIEDLQKIEDPRSAVIACYAHMRVAAMSSGADVAPSDTPFEALDTLLVQGNVSRSSATVLTELFERARFSQHAIDESMRAAALSALEDVRDELREAP